MELNFNQIMFIIISGIIILFSILTVTTKRILRAATFLLFVLVATAGLYFMLNYQFLAAVQLTLYAGGIVVLIIFSILLTSHISQKFDEISISKKILSALAVIAGMVVCIITILQYKFPPTVISPEELNMKVIGNSLLNYGRNGYALPFEVISVLLLAAMVGAIVVAKKVKKQL
ncbi:MAG: NADH-quinone oxidoreductase subunit J [Bacteroidales bacterium]|jgi:NADH-quinone oxidoreductase subunit J